MESNIQFTRIERFIASFTPYSQLSRASDEEFPVILSRLQAEWNYVGALMLGIVGIGMTVLGFAKDSAYVANDYPLRSLTFSTYISVLGLASTVWFWLRYSWIDGADFQARARDLFHGFMSFSLAARVPSLCLYAATLSWLPFHGPVAFTVWPVLVGTATCVIGLVMTGQFWVYGICWLAVRIGDRMRTVSRYMWH